MIRIHAYPFICVIFDNELQHTVRSVGIYGLWIGNY